MKTHPKNKFKFCPQCGDKALKYNHGDYFSCAACGMSYFINMSGAVAAIIHNNRGEVLFTVRAKNPAQGMLDLPGGFIDIGESAEDAVVREVKEELNLNICEMKYFTSQPNHYIYNDLSYFTIDLCYICKVDSFDEIKSMDDVSAFKFVHPNTVRLNEIGLTSIREMIKKYKKLT